MLVLGVPRGSVILFAALASLFADRHTRYRIGDFVHFSKSVAGQPIGKFAEYRRDVRERFSCFPVYGLSNLLRAFGYIMPMTFPADRERHYHKRRWVE